MAIDFPNSPTIGDTYTTEGRTWEWDGTVWLALEPPVRFSYVQSTAPEDPIVGSGWFDTTTARFFVYYDGYWVESGTSSAFPEVTTPLSYNAETNTVSVDLSGKQDVVAGVSDTEIGYLDGVTSGIQTQLNGKASSSHTHAISDITSLETTLDSKKTENVYEISSNVTLSLNSKNFINTSSTRTVSLPASPNVGDEIWIIDQNNLAATNNITVNNGGSLINGLSDILVIDSNGAVAILLYTGSTLGWRI